MSINTIKCSLLSSSFVALVSFDVAHALWNVQLSRYSHSCMLINADDDRPLNTWCAEVYNYNVERGSSVVECRTRNQVSPGSNPPFATVSKIEHFRSLH